MKGALVGGTASLCPVCLERVAARQVLRGNQVFLDKECPAHGAFSTVIWRENHRLDMLEWQRGLLEGRPPLPAHCPGACGLCGHHLRDTCCLLLEVTGDCDLGCPFCLAGEQGAATPPLEELKEAVAALGAGGQRFLQVSGGEPTLRDDLPELVAWAKESGFRYVQLNTNGLRLARDGAYVRRLAAAGLSFVFLQFDGTRDGIYQALRGRPLLAEKLKAVERCGEAGLGVTLVSTVAPGVNDGDMGRLIRLAVSLSPVVRGVHFQPISFLGRYGAPPTDDMRITLPEVILGIEAQCGGMVAREHLLPSRCDHALCGFHGDFVVLPEGLLPLKTAATAAEGRDCCGPGGSPAVSNQNYVGRRWERACCGAEEEAAPDMGTLDGFVGRVRSHGFTVTAMAFQDCWTVDLDRLRQCSLHVYDGGRIVPLCARYLTAAKGGSR